ncbi:MAG: thermonuclease family protein [Candidatus Eremiobacteraeota bacterium]|nr:thermonuclease family protein [Candidatus Eremiobacteraeota bacterium]
MKKVTILTITLLVLMAASVFAESFTGVVVSIEDGNNILVKNGSGISKVKIDGVVCPELEQEYGQETKLFMEEQLWGKEVWVDVKSKDHYGRYVANVKSGNEDVALTLAKNGMAWYNQKAFSPAVAAAEKESRASRTGLWASENPVSPWAFRQAKLGIIPDRTGKPVGISKGGFGFSGVTGGYGYAPCAKASFGDKPIAGGYFGSSKGYYGNGSGYYAGRAQSFGDSGVKRGYYDNGGRGYNGISRGYGFNHNEKGYGFPPVSTPPKGWRSVVSTTTPGCGGPAATTSPGCGNFKFGDPPLSSSPAAGGPGGSRWDR